MCVIFSVGSRYSQPTGNGLLSGRSDEMETSLISKLKKYGQAHLIQFADQLSAADLDHLCRQIEQVEWQQLTALAKASDQNTDWNLLADQAEPPPAIKLDDVSPQVSRQTATLLGQQAIRDGKVAVILVAGGQGTRLGFDQPKGMFPIGPLSGRSLFQMHCDRLRAISRRFQVEIPLLVMTSPATDQETRQYFENEHRCGLAQDQLNIFCQGTMPAVDAATGQALLATMNSLALSPDGHGGLVSALERSGCLKQAAGRGVEYLYYAQVDNPLAPLCDPELIGYHIATTSQMTTQVVKKRFAQEKVGNVVAVNGQVQIIEYSDLPDHVAKQCNPDGSLKLWAGNIAIHVFDRHFLQSVVDSQLGLPFHRALKKVPYLDSTGRLVEPQQANAIKYERFIFDLLPIAQRAMVVEGDPARVFAPVKNSNQANLDTPKTCQQAMLNQFHQWIQAAGSTIEQGVSVEISPLWALDAQETAKRLSNPVHFSVDTFLS